MQRLGLGALILGVALIGLAYGAAWSSAGVPLWGVWSMILGAALLMSGMLALVAARSGMDPRRTAAASVVLLMILLAGFGLPVVLPVEHAGSQLVLGLPVRAALEIYGVGLLPALFLPLLFAVEFREAGLDQDSLDQLRVECERLRRTADPS